MDDIIKFIFDIIKIGILGNDYLKPWQIILIFFTVAYISISTDITGIFELFAYKIVKKAKNNGLVLFLFFYFFACILTIFTSNDIVILTLTPIIFYLGTYAKINIIPLLFAQFFGANTSSMLLYIGNPTNIIIANTLNISFFEYTKIMLFPTIIAVIFNLIFLYLFFRKKITLIFNLEKNKEYELKNILNPYLSIFILIIMLFILIISEKINISIWKITLFFTIVFLIKDFIFTKNESQIKKVFFRIPMEIITNNYFFIYFC